MPPGSRLLSLILIPCTLGSVFGESAVEVVPVVFSQVERGQRAVGSVVPVRVAVVGSALDGRVESFLVNAGQRVEAGQTLAELRPTTLQIQLAAAQAELRMFQSQLEELQNGSLPEDIEEAEANMLATKALMENAEGQWKRLQTLSASRAASAAELETALEQAEATRYALRAAEAKLQRVQDGPRPELIAQAQARVELQVQQVKLLEDNLDKLTIRAPFAGYIASESTEVGSWIRTGDPVVEIMELDRVEIEVPVTAELAVPLAPGDAVRVEFPELPDELLVGTIDRIVPVADSQTRTFPVFIRMENRLRGQRPLLMSGMLARVELPSGRPQPAMLVPKDALVLNGNDRSVFVVDAAGGGAPRSGDGSDFAAAKPFPASVRKVGVDLGVAVAGLIQVRGDMDADDLVVVTGNERLVDGAEVSVSFSDQYVQPEPISSAEPTLRPQ